MIFRQFRFEKLGQASYLVGCARSKEALVVDPIADLGVDHYVIEAADRGLAVTHVLETHIHADFISCARELAEAMGAEHCLFHTAPVKYAFTPLEDGQLLKLGQVHVQVLATPGHTPEHASFVVTDRARGAEPWFVLTGDSLFVGDVGRPDLLIGDQALDVLDEAERARLQYRVDQDEAIHPAGARRGLPGTLRRFGVRRHQHEWQGSVDDLLREALQPGDAAARCRGVRAIRQGNRQTVPRQLRWDQVT